MKADELKPFYYKTFRIEELKNFFNEPESTIKAQLSRLCKANKLVRLKKNLYTFTDFHPDSFTIGQEMISPSYYSLETVLSLNGIIPEGAAVYTLITSKKTQQYKNRFGTFSYRHLPPQFYFGVERREDGVFMATPEKALLDYLYLNSSSFQTDFSCFREQRFDGLENLNFNLIKKWAKQFNMKKLMSLVDCLKNYSNSDEYQEHR